MDSSVVRTALYILALAVGVVTLSVGALAVAVACSFVCLVLLAEAIHKSGVRKGHRDEIATPGSGPTGGFGSNGDHR